MIKKTQDIFGEQISNLKHFFFQHLNLLKWYVRINATKWTLKAKRHT